MDQIHYSGYFTTSSLCCFFQPLRLCFVHFHSFIILSPPLLSPIILFICFSSFSQLAVESRFSVQIESIGLFYAHNTHTYCSVAHTRKKNRNEREIDILFPFSLSWSAILLWIKRKGTISMRAMRQQCSFHIHNPTETTKTAICVWTHYAFTQTQLFLEQCQK